jgi:thioester reductase-like protein
MEWALRQYDRKGMNKAAVAVANKIARISWKILKTKKMTFVSTTSVGLSKEGSVRLLALDLIGEETIHEEGMALKI